MSYRVHITQAAEKDLNHAADYIEFVLKNPQAADQLLGEAEKQINSLSSFPKKYPLAEDKVLALWGVRFLNVNNYLVFYLVSDEEPTVTVVRFLYCKSNWLSVLRQGFSLT